MKDWIKSLAPEARAELRAELVGRIPGITDEAVKRFQARADERMAPAPDQPTNEVRLFGEIVSSDDIIVRWFGEEGFTTPDSFKAQLDRAQGDITLLIDSPGGDHFAGNSIAALTDGYREKGNRVTARVLGLAASAATYAMVRADEVLADPTSSIMAHAPWGPLRGNAKAHRAFADVLDQHGGASAAVYAKRRGITRAKVDAYMDEERYFVGQEAVDAGWVDRLVEGETEAAGAEASGGETVEARMSETARNIRDAVARMALGSPNC